MDNYCTITVLKGRQAGCKSLSAKYLQITEQNRQQRTMEETGEEPVLQQLRRRRKWNWLEHILRRSDDRAMTKLSRL